MRSVRALEEGDALDENGDVAMYDAEPVSKRRKVETEGDSSPSEDTSSPSTPPQQPEPPKPSGLLSSDTLEGLKYFAQIRKRNGMASVQSRAPPPPSTTGLGLADYGSDED